MSANEFIVGLREDQVADLGPCVDAADRLIVQSVPKTDMLVSSATSSC